MLDALFSKYQEEARQADILFKSIKEKYPLSVTCHIHCCDCCYAIFGVFPIEAAYINYYFNRLERRIKREILRRAEKAEREIIKAKDKLKLFEDDEKMKVYGLGKQRVRCPLLSDKNECELYERRPIICRIYGVPYSIYKGRKEHSYVCSISNFQEKATYQTVKIDKIYNRLVQLSEELLKEGLVIKPETKANLMIPLSRVLRMSLDDIIKGNFED